MSERRPKLPKFIIVLNILMIVIILAICALVFSLAFSVFSSDNESSSEPYYVETEEVTSDDPELPSATTTTAATTTTPPVSMTKQTENTTEPVVITTADITADEPETSSDTVGTSFDKSFFADDLFIGDSISTGLYLYGKLDQKNVAAAVGYTPYKAYTSAADIYDGSGKSALEYAESMQPKRIFIMLGSNGMSANGDLSAMESTYRTLIDKLTAACPSSTLYCISVSPVTADSSAAAYSSITNEVISTFNGYIKDICDEKGIKYFDLYSKLLDSTGYFSKEYAEVDGLHFMGTTYDVMLSWIESELS